jgi:MFS family permease
MILGRCIQGAGGAFMFSTAAGIITAAFPPSDRGRALGLNVTAVYVGLTLGPVVGGLIVSHASWRWIFFINVPIAAATVLAGWTLLRAERGDRRQRQPRPAPIDWAGAGLLGAALVALFVPLTYSPLWGWGAPDHCPARAHAVFLVAFVLVEDRSKAMLDLDLLRKNRVLREQFSRALITWPCSP